VAIGRFYWHLQLRPDDPLVTGGSRGATGRSTWIRQAIQTIVFILVGVQDAYLTAAAIADELGISKSGVYKLIKRGRLPAIRHGKRNLRISHLALDAYQRRLQAAACPCRSST
jgi:excisionase family DNA binding protein